MSDTKMPAKFVLITGATSGIGLALAQVFARQGYDLVIVSRKQEDLIKTATELKNQFGGKIITLAKDLSQAGAAQEVYDEIQRQNIDVDILVNNAGYAEHGFFKDVPLEKELSLVQLNMASVMVLTKLFLDNMLKRNSGRILNLGSTASFQPGGPLMSVYYATKAFVLSLTEAIAEEIKDSKVTVTALCPGPTRTAFQNKAKIHDTLLIKTNMMSADHVAEIAYRGLMRGKTIVIPGWMNKLQIQALRIAPRVLVRKVIYNLQKKR
jgi:short-subunit dehydrogenase